MRLPPPPPTIDGPLGNWLRLAVGRLNSESHIDGAIYNVTVFGATGNGRTDDATSIQRLLTHCKDTGGGTVFFPPGVYVIGSTLSLYPTVHLRGVGRNESILSAATSLASYVLAKTGSSHESFPITIADLKLVGNSTLSAIGYFHAADYLDIHRVAVESATSSRGHGLYFQNCYWLQLDQIHLSSVSSAGIVFAAAGGVGCNQSVLRNSEIIGNNQPNFVGLVVERSQNVDVYGNDFEGSSNGSAAIDVIGCEGIHLHDNYIELWTQPAIRFSRGTAQTQRVQISHNVINSSASVVVDLHNATSAVSGCVMVNNRGADLTSAQTFVRVGNTSNFVSLGNDANSATWREGMAAATGLDLFATPTVYVGDQNKVLQSSGDKLTINSASAAGEVALRAAGEDRLVASAGTVNLVNNRLVSVRTTGTSLSSQNMVGNEVALFIGGASGASLAIRSGGTIWIFNSSLSTTG